MPSAIQPDTDFMANWLARAAASIDAYQPDLLYLDTGFGGPGWYPYMQSLAAHFYNRAAMWNQHVVLTAKDGYPGHTAVTDVELGTKAGLDPDIWQSDTSVAVAAWGYVTNATYKDPALLVLELIDCVSKNGIFLLNVGPRSDGTIAPEHRQIIERVGNWLSINGESIYGTRPWNVYAEGPNTLASGSFGDYAAPPVFTGRDIRFTRKGNILYAALLGWPGSQAKIASLASNRPVPVSGAISRVELLGYRDPLVWSQTTEGLVVNLPQIPGEAGYPHVLKITGLKMSGIPQDTNGTLRLNCSQASFNQFAVQRLQFGLTEGCYWNNLVETATWTASFPAPGTYAVTVAGSAAAGATSFQLTGCKGQKLTVEIPGTDDWGQFRTIHAGYLAVSNAGDCDLTVQPIGSPGWQPMNLAHIDLHSVILASADRSLHLTAETATVNGARLHLEKQGGIADIGFWNDGTESVSWLAHFASAGVYSVSALYANGEDDVSATIDIGDQPALGSLVLEAASTQAWDRFTRLGAGQVTVQTPGDYTVSVRATDPANWRAINLAYLELTPLPDKPSEPQVAGASLR